MQLFPQLFLMHNCVVWLCRQPRYRASLSSKPKGSLKAMHADGQCPIQQVSSQTDNKSNSDSTRAWSLHMDADDNSQTCVRTFAQDHYQAAEGSCCRSDYRFSQSRVFEAAATWLHSTSVYLTVFNADFIAYAPVCTHLYVIYWPQDQWHVKHNKRVLAIRVSLQQNNKLWNLGVQYDACLCQQAIDMWDEFVLDCSNGRISTGCSSQCYQHY